jgi:hypothetical protein
MMARPIKSGMDYFSHDTDAHADIKMKKLMAYYGVEGYGIYFYLLELIYRSAEYLIDLQDESTIVLIASDMKINASKLNEIISQCVKFGLFDSEKWQSKLLTSLGVIKRAQVIEDKRDKRRGIMTEQNHSFDNTKPDLCNTKTMVMDSRNTQNKQKESKEKESNMFVDITRTRESDTKINAAREVILNHFINQIQVYKIIPDEKQLDVAREVIEVMVDALIKADTKDGLKFNLRTIYRDEFLSAVALIKGEPFEKIVNAALHRDDIEKRPQWILGCIFNKAEDEKNKRGKGNGNN